MDAPWTVRPASPADAEVILTLEQACAEAPHWSPDVWQQILSHKEAQQPARVAFIAEGCSGILGFAVVSCAAEVAELESIAVHPSARCQGIGKGLCHAVFDWARTAGAEVIELEVRASSVAAHALYASLGFTKQGRRRNYYRNPVDDAILMSALL
jgi:ribosomal-protein-alanine N-acetyltransferase